MLCVRPDGLTMDALMLFRELLTDKYADRPHVGQQLLSLERDHLQGWELVDRLRPRSRLLSGRLRRSRLPAALHQLAPDCLRSAGQSPYRLDLPFDTFNEMDEWLQQMSVLGLRRLSLVQLRLWLLFAVARAICLTRNRAAGALSSAPTAEEAVYQELFSEIGILLTLDLGEWPRRPVVSCVVPHA